jgi:hypothetical protein
LRHARKGKGRRVEGQSGGGKTRIEDGESRIAESA